MENSGSLAVDSVRVEFLREETQQVFGDTTMAFSGGGLSPGQQVTVSGSWPIVWDNQGVSLGARAYLLDDAVELTEANNVAKSVSV